MTKFLILASQQKDGKYRATCPFCRGSMVSENNTHGHSCDMAPDSVEGKVVRSDGSIVVTKRRKRGEGGSGEMNKKAKLGDWVEKQLASLGVTPENYKAVKEKLGLPPTCNCKSRKTWLNDLSDYVSENKWLTLKAVKQIYKNRNEPQ